MAAKAIGHNRITDLTAARGLGYGLAGDAVPAGSRYAVLTPETQDVRVLSDGSNPTATEGLLLKVGQMYTLQAPPHKIRVIQAAASAALNVEFYSA